MEAYTEVKRAFTEMRRQDNEATKTGTVPEYQRTGVVYTSPAGQSNSNTSQNLSSGKQPSI